MNRSRWGLIALLVLGSTAVEAEEPRVTPADPDACLKDDLCRAQYSLARELSKTGNLKAALAAYEAAFQRQAVPMLLFNIARLHHRLGNYPQAVTGYRRYLQTNAASEAAQRSRAQEYLLEALQGIEDTKQTESSRDVPLQGQIGAAQSSIPDCTQNSICSGMYDRAQTQSAQGNYADAARLYKLAYQVVQDPRILYSVARVLHKDGTPDDARAYYQRFIDSPLDDPPQKQKASEFLAQLAPMEKSSAPVVPWRGTSSEAPEVQAPPTPTERAPSTLATKRSFPVGAATLLGLGGASVLSGAVLGGLTLSASKQVTSGDGAFDQALYDRGVVLNRVAISLDVIGGVLLGGGAIWTVIWLAKRSRATPTVAIANLSGGLGP